MNKIQHTVIIGGRQYDPNRYSLQGMGRAIYDRDGGCNLIHDVNNEPDFHVPVREGVTIPFGHLQKFIEGLNHDEHMYLLEVFMYTTYPFSELNSKGEWREK